MSRRSKTNYFDPAPGAPPPLTARAERRVRFEEVDALSIVWHGHYPSYLEDASMTFGEKHGLSYLDMQRHGFLAPLVQLHLDYHQPLLFPERCVIEAALHWTDAARLNMQYAIFGAEEKVAATGYSVQLLTDLERNILLVRPPYVEELCRRWQTGELATRSE